MTLSQMPLNRMCVQALDRDPSQPALEFAGRWTSWGELRSLADALGTLLRMSGAAEAAPIAFVPRNRPTSVAALLGMLARARTVRMVYGFQAPPAVARELSGLKPAVVVADAEDFSAEVRNALHDCGAAGIALTATGVAQVDGLQRVADHRGPHDGVGRTGTTAPPQIEILTSGTTGAPKRFGMSHAMVAEHIVGANKNYTATGVDYAKEPPAFLYYPLGNISGIYSVLPTLLRGQRVSLVERFSVEAWRDHIRRHRPERASLPSAGFQMVLDVGVPAEELAGVRSIATGAAPLPESVHRAFEARYGIPVLLSYGATEFGGPVASMTAQLRAEWGDEKLTSVGRPIGGAQLRIVDAATGDVLRPGEEGILEVITPRIGPNWIRTSDVAVIDEDGFLFHRGRADGAIMRGGFKLLPTTIEEALRLHPAVSDAVVVGLPDARLGQVPAAVVQVCRGVKQPAEEDLERHLRAHVYATHVPAAWCIVDELPRNASFKVDRAAARRLFEQRPEAEDAPLAEASPG